MNINYLIGDATYPIGDGRKIIAHINNDIGAWGSGFVLAVSKRWKEPEKQYRSLRTYELGNVQFVQVERDIVVANMIAQHKTGVISNIPPIRYDSLKKCLISLNESAITLGATIHMPKIGSGIAGGDWDVIQDIIESTLTRDVYVYTLPTISLNHFI